MPYIGKKPENIIATAIDTTTGTFSGDVTSAGTVNVTGDTAAGDDAAIGFTSAEGLILTGQGSTSDVIIKNDADTTVCFVPTGTDDLKFNDNAAILLGTDSDMQIIHDGSNSIVADNGTGNLVLRSNATAVEIDFNTDETSALFNHNGSVELYHDNSKKFETTSSGVTVTGDIANSSGDMTIDVAGDIILDADGADIKLKDGGTQFGQLYKNGNDFRVESNVSDGDLVFTGNDGGTGVTALTLDMSDGGAATFAKGITLTNGNVALANGNGIDFSATGGPTSGSDSTELLDDYEEGTFTPTLANTGGVQVAAYDIQVGFYTKIGRMVHANVVISANGLGSAGTSNVILLGGLPYDSLSSTNHDTAISVSHAVNLNITAGQNLGGFLPANSTNIRLSLYDSTQGTTDFTFGELSTDGQIKVSIQYNTG
jgi:hypothetical protein